MGADLLFTFILEDSYDKLLTELKNSQLNIKNFKEAIQGTYLMFYPTRKERQIPRPFMLFYGYLVESVFLLEKIKNDSDEAKACWYIASELLRFAGMQQWEYCDEKYKNYLMIGDDFEDEDDGNHFFMFFNIEEFDLNSLISEMNSFENN